MSHERASANKYFIGFALSLIFTLVPYMLVMGGYNLNRTMVLAGLAVFAVLQVYVQLIFFLHLGSERGPRFKSFAFAFMTLVVLIVVFGSLWIMNNLHYKGMPQSDIDSYIIQKEAIEPSNYKP